MATAPNPAEEPTVPPAPPLLATKLHVPVARGHKVHRGRLFDRLDQGTQTALSLVAAPAGFGKSTLLSDWLHSRPRPAGWVSLEPSDNDLRRFLSYLAAALEHPLPGVSRGLVAALASSRLPDPEPLLTPLLNELWERPSCVLVLDDYHVIEAAEIHEALNFLVEHLPPAMHVVIASRSYPPLHLPRLRARGLLAELRSEDLRFTCEEAAGFLRDSMGLQVTAAEVEALERRTEGWIAGLQMAALSLRGREEVGTFLAGFTGSHRFVLDYLTEEVLDRQPPDRLGFLLRTSVLPRLCGDLCDTVTGRNDSQEILEALETANLFLIPLDERRRWYRYHHLFASLLQEELRHRMSDAELVRLHETAADWFAAHQLPEEALAHASAAACWERSVAILEAYADLYLSRGEIGTVSRWFEGFPHEELRGRPRLLLLRAVVLFSTLRWPEFNALLPELEASVQATGEQDPELSARLDTLISFQLTGKGDFPAVIAHARRALERIPADNPSRGVVAGVLGIALARTCQSAEAMEVLEEAARLNYASGNFVGAVIARCNQGWLEEVHGRLAASRERFEQALRMVATLWTPRLPAAAPAWAGLADVALERGDLEGAFEMATIAVELGKASEVTGQVRSLASLSRVQAARGELDEARRTLEHLAALIRMTGIEIWHSVTRAVQARFDLVQARRESRADLLAGIGRWAEREGLLDGCEAIRERFLPDTHCDYAHLTAARWLIVSGQPERALELLSALEKVAAEEGWISSQIEIALLEALAHQKRVRAAGRRREPPDEAFDALARALKLAEPEGYVQVFLGEGEPFFRLLAAYDEARPGALAGTLWSDRLDQALGVQTREVALPVFPPAVSVQAAGRAMNPPGEPLSERELEVLRAIASGLSNAEAAKRLYLSPFTVKKHLENIYGKLGVHNRTEAIARAQGLRLIPVVGG
ncbi:MAG TPA: LuxR C-terminal-related transcriptional regulator [Thermoanaerobaculia bacterium]|nr:LuxR C-terminal-related transcriptional regulator [Thermoanaerobaculia bacterium]